MKLVKGALVALAVLGVYSVMSQVAMAAEGQVELLRDNAFSQGFMLNDPAPGQKLVVDTLVPADTAQSPVWELTQWNSRYDLKGATRQALPGGGVSFSNAGKTVVIGPGADGGDLTLGIAGRMEYPERARKASDPWVHLLVEQTFEENPAVADMSALEFRGQFRLTKSVLVKTPDYNTGMHAAQFLVYLTVANLNRESAGYGDFLWFGVPVYDNRYKVIPEYMAQDFAVVTGGKFIYSPASSRYTREKIGSGEWTTLEKDILPYVKTGLANAWKKGYLKDSKDLADYHIGYMNMGWELPGIFDVEMKVRGMSLRAALLR